MAIDLLALVVIILIMVCLVVVALRDGVVLLRGMPEANTQSESATQTVEQQGGLSQQLRDIQKPLK